MPEDFEIVTVKDIPKTGGPGTHDPMVTAILALPPKEAIKKKYPTLIAAKKKMRSLLSNFHFCIGVRIHTKIVRNEDDCDLYVWRHVEK